MTSLLGRDALARAVRSAGIEVEPVWHDRIGSTNTEAMRLGAGGAQAWTVVAAGHQTAGRGRLGRTWDDATGTSLLVSILLRPVALPPDRAPLVSLQAAVVMVEVAGASVLRSKWPNDLVAGNRKVGGILAEARVGPGGIDHLVLGIGLNVHTPAADLPEGATSLAEAGGDDDPERVLARFLAGFRSGLEDPGFPGDVADRYSAVCATIGRVVRAVTIDGTTVEGTAVGLDERGGLLIDTGRERSTVAFGEVEHLR